MNILLKHNIYFLMSFMNSSDGLNIPGTKAVIKALQLPQRTEVAFGNHFSNFARGNYSGHLALIISMELNIFSPNLLKKICHSMACIAASVPKESINGSGIGTHDSYTLAALCGQFSTACSHPKTDLPGWNPFSLSLISFLNKINIWVLPLNKIKT